MACLLFQGYYTAAHALARTARQMSRQLWKPSTDSDGISFEMLLSFTTSLTEWREKYLNLVGVPNNHDGEWDFVSVSFPMNGFEKTSHAFVQAVSSCASDATYHVMWIILFNAVDDFNIRELSQTPPPNVAQIEAVKQKVVEEALHSALRIAGLASLGPFYNIRIPRLTTQYNYLNRLPFSPRMAISVLTLPSCTSAASKLERFSLDWGVPR